VIDLPADIPRDVPGLWEGYQQWLEERGIRQPRVAVHGGYGKNNLGDDAILDVLIERTLRHLPDARITVVCHGPDNVRRRYDDVAGLTACHFKSRAAAVAVVRSHIYIIGGGGIVNRINVYSGRQRWKILDPKGKVLFLAALGAKLAGAKTHFYAIGATSFPDAGVKALARLVLRTADTVSVRDPLSVENLRSLGLRREIVRVLDPALSLRPDEPEAAESVLQQWGVAARPRRRVGVAFRYVRDASTDNQAKVRAVADLVRHLVRKTGCQVVFIPASHHPSEHYEDDLDFGRQVRSILGPTDDFSLIEQYYHPRLMMALLAAMDFNLMERLHAVILTSQTEVPFFAVAYDAKVAEYARLVGCADRMIPSDRLWSEPDYTWLEPHLAAVRGASQPDGVPREPA